MVHRVFLLLVSSTLSLMTDLHLFLYQTKWLDLEPQCVLCSSLYERSRWLQHPSLLPSLFLGFPFHLPLHWLGRRKHFTGIAHSCFSDCLWVPGDFLIQWNAKRTPSMTCVPLQYFVDKIFFFYFTFTCFCGTFCCQADIFLMRNYLFLWQMLE